jgi:hypothetical protein
MLHLQDFLSENKTSFYFYITVEHLIRRDKKITEPAWEFFDVRPQR